MEEAIRITGLKKIYRTGFFLKPFMALDGISLSVYKNELYGFLGPNGAGKTTTIKILNSIIYPTEGEVRIFDEPLGNVQQKRSIGFLPEHPFFYEYLTAWEILMFCGNLFGLKKRERERRAEELLEIVGLKDAIHLQLRKFSKGMLQRIGMAQALINDPELVILDEPMSGLDPIGRLEIRELIRDLKNRGKTVFFSSHIISDVELLADRVCILHRGRKVAEGRIGDLLGGEAIKYYEICVEGIERTDELIAALNGSFVSHFLRGNVLVFHVPSELSANRVIDAARDAKGNITAIIPVRVNLEELFIEKVGG